MPNKADPSLQTWATNKPGQDERTDLPSWMAYSALQLVYGHTSHGRCCHFDLDAPYYSLYGEM